MALTFPLSLAQFMDLLPVSSCIMHCPAQVQVARDGGGEILPADIGPRLWTADLTLGKMTAAEARPLRPLLTLLGQAGTSVMLYDTARPWPLADSGGVALGAATPTIASLSGDNRELSLSGLPAGYTLTAGDLIAFSYGSNPVRYAMHEFVAGSVADGTGATGLIEVTPPIRSGATVGTEVTLGRPSCKMQLVPGSLKPGQVTHTITDGIGFSLIQTLR